MQNQTKQFAIVLSGCGNKDGSEITEAVSTLIAVSESKAEYKIYAPDLEIQSCNHLTESARIAGRQVYDLIKLKAAEFDAIIFPGGFGAALHLCTFAKMGASCTVLPDAKRVIQEFYYAEKPIGAFCIAPALVAAALRDEGITLTIGDNLDTAKEIEKMGAYHVVCAVDDFISDREKKVVTTPAYMYEATPSQIFTGIRKAVKELVEMA